MNKKNIFVFHNGFKRGVITFDCRLRIEAARQVALENSAAIVCFVGGGGISGAQDMKKFWRENYPELTNELFQLGKASNTAGSVGEIAEYVLNYQEEKEIILISSSYHIKRIEFFAKRYGMHASIVAAENILETTREFKDEVRKYRNSFQYFWKLVMEKIAILYVMGDPDQKMVKLWREYRRD